LKTASIATKNSRQKQKIILLKHYLEIWVLNSKTSTSEISQLEVAPCELPVWECHRLEC